MSQDISKLPPNVQERVLRLQQLQKTLQKVLAQKQQVERELTEIEQAKTELKKVADDAVIYKSVGSLLMKDQKEEVSADLDEREELLNTRTEVLERQEERLRGQLKKLQTKIQEELKPLS